jgi:hypothetical protein
MLVFRIFISKFLKISKISNSTGQFSSVSESMRSGRVVSSSQELGLRSNF